MTDADDARAGRIGDLRVDVPGARGRRGADRRRPVAARASSGRHYGCSLHVRERHRGKGFGRAATAAGEQAALATGDDTLMFTVRGGADVGMSLYTSAGHQVVEESRPTDLTRPAAREA